MYLSMGYRDSFVHGAISTNGNAVDDGDDGRQYGRGGLSIVQPDPTMCRLILMFRCLVLEPLYNRSMPATIVPNNPKAMNISYGKWII